MKKYIPSLLVACVGVFVILFFIFYKTDRPVVTLEENEGVYFVLVQDEKGDITIPVEGMVSPRVGFVNDDFIGVYLHTEASTGYIVEAVLINRETQEVKKVTGTSEERILALQEDGNFVLLYDFPSKEFQLVDFDGSIQSSYGLGNVELFTPHHAEFSPNGDRVAIYETMGAGSTYPEQKYAVYVLDIESGDLVLVRSSEDGFSVIEWK